MMMKSCYTSATLIILMMVRRMMMVVSPVTVMMIFLPNICTADDTYKVDRCRVRYSPRA